MAMLVGYRAMTLYQRVEPAWIVRPYHIFARDRGRSLPQQRKCSFNATICFRTNRPKNQRHRQQQGVILKQPMLGLVWHMPPQCTTTTTTTTTRCRRAVQQQASLYARFASSSSSSSTPPPSPPKLERMIKVRRKKVVGLSSEEANIVTTTTNASTIRSTFWKRFVGPKPMPERYTFAWYREMLLICTVFAVTGTSTMVLVRPAVSDWLGIHGSLREGPWTYRICSLVIMTPIYATLLVVVGTAFGRHYYFRHFSVKIWSRFGIPPEMLDKTYHETKNTFRKW